MAPRDTDQNCYSSKPLVNSGLIGITDIILTRQSTTINAFRSTAQGVQHVPYPYRVPKPAPGIHHPTPIPYWMPLHSTPPHQPRQPRQLHKPSPERIGNPPCQTISMISCPYDLGCLRRRRSLVPSTITADLKTGKDQLDTHTPT